MKKPKTKEYIFKYLRKNKMYSKFSDERLMEMAEQRVVMGDSDLDITRRFVDREEQTLAKDLLKKYCKDYVIETISDKNTLKQLIYLEVIQNRLETSMNQLHTENKAVPLQIMDSLHKNIDEIIVLKETLGITKKNKEQDVNPIEILKKKFKKWRENNQGSRTLVCPHCSKMILLKIRTEVWEAQKHPFFKDKILANVGLVKLYKEGKLNKEDVALILECSPDYIDWLIPKWFQDNTTPVEDVTNPPEGNATTTNS